MFWTALLLLEDNNYAKLFLKNPCINVPVMARTSSIYDHFYLYLAPATLTFNLHEKMFQMALLLFEDNNCANLFWNPCINVQVMARKSSIYDHFDLYLTPVTLTFNLREKMFQMALLLLEDKKCANYFWNPCINVQLIAWSSSIYDHFDFYLTLSPWPSTYRAPDKQRICVNTQLNNWNTQMIFCCKCTNTQIKFPVRNYPQTRSVTSVLSYKWNMGCHVCKQNRRVQVLA